MKELSGQQLFEIKQKFLMDIPHPKLIQKHLASLVDKIPESAPSIVEESKQSMSLLNFMKSYLDELMPLKLRISNSSTGEQLQTQLEELLLIQLGLIRKLLSYCPSDVELETNFIKQSDPFKVYDYIKELEENEIEENQINSYLCLQFEGVEQEEISEFGKAVLRARKIDEHGG